MAGAGQLTNTFDRYDAIGEREELSDLISDISPTDTPLTSNIGSAPTGNTFFEWQTDSLAAAAQNHQIDGFDVTTFTAQTATTRLGNYTSISEKDFMVSGTQERMNKAGRSSEVGYLATKAAKELKRDCETNYLANNAAVAGNGTTAREGAGIVAFIKTNTDKSATNGTDPVWTSSPTGARSDGVERADSETILKSVIKKVYDSGGDPTMVMVPSFLKQQASAYAGIAAQRFMAPAGPSTIVGAADLYVSDFGTLSIVPNRFMRAIDMLVIDPMEVRERVFRDFELHELAKTGDAEKRLLVVEKGLQVDNEAAHGIATDLTSA